MHKTENLNVAAFDLMPSPEEVKAKAPLTEAAARTVVQSRRTIEAILDGRDPRLFVVVGRARCTIPSPASTTRGASAASPTRSATRSTS